MKLATLRDGSRDGRLVVVSRDLTRASDVRHIAPTLQAALDDWDRVAPQLDLVARGVEAGGQPVERFHEREAMAPLPRAHQFADGSAYLNHAELVRRARGETLPDALRREPLIYQGGSDGFLAPRDPIRLADADWGIDLEAEVAVLLGDVPMGADRAAALGTIRLVTLMNDVSLRELIPAELAKGFGFFQSKPASALAPVAVTPDELGPTWDEARLAGALLVEVNGAPLGRADAGEGMDFDFADLIVHAARTRALGAGSVLGSGTVSNRGPDGGPGRPVAEGGRGYSCIAELRMVETLLHGAPRTPYLRFGDVVRIEMKDAAGHSIFGAIEQRVEPWPGE
jgi:fumarylacetoacetate (FAA) hydrolase